MQSNSMELEGLDDCPYIEETWDDDGEKTIFCNADVDISCPNRVEKRLGHERLYLCKG